MRALSIATIALLAAPLTAQTSAPSAPDPYARAVAAGYKALTLCSAVFVAGRTQAQVEALELTGTYPEYDAMLPTLPARVDQANGAVTVTYDGAMPPRRAAFAAGKGCTNPADRICAANTRSAHHLAGAARQRSPSVAVG